MLIIGTFLQHRVAHAGLILLKEVRSSSGASDFAARLANAATVRQSDLNDVDLHYSIFPSEEGLAPGSALCQIPSGTERSSRPSPCSWPLLTHEFVE